MKKQSSYKQHFPAPYPVPGFSKESLIGIIIAVFLLVFSTARSQTFVKTYRFPKDLKEYIPVQVTGSTDETVMAGTIFNSSNDINFMHVNASGNIVGNDDRVYDDGGRDERVVSMVETSAGRYIITALIRGASPGDKDRIKLLSVNTNGSITQDRIIESATGNTYSNMYPLSSMYYNGLLYVCGYVTQSGTSTPGIPSYLSDKRAFVLAYNPSTLAVVACNTYDYNFSSAPTLNMDYDIAMRMKATVTATGTAIFVTGSANAVSDSASIPVYSSGTMCLIIDPVTLGVYYPPTIPFPNGSNNVIIGSTNRIIGEYGVGVMEESGGSGFFVVGNQETNTVTNPSTLLPMFLQLTYVNNTGYIANPTGPRLLFHQFDYAWGLQSLRSVSTGIGTNLTVAGVQTNAPAGCISAALLPSNGNIDPFIADFTVGQAGGSITGGLNYWKTYLCQTGTGGAGNGYLTLGGWLSNISWNPTFAMRRNGSPNPNDLLLTAPSWNPAQFLNLKLIHANSAGIIQACNAGFKQCTYDAFDHVPASNSGTSAITLSNLVAPYTTNTPFVGGSTIDSIHVTTLDCQVNGVFRTANPYGEMDNDLTSKENITISPNPASTFVDIDLHESVSVETTVKIDLRDMTGRVVALLYDKPANALIFTGRLMLPDLTPGIYFIRLSLGDKLVTTQKLQIK